MGPRASAAALAAQDPALQPLYTHCCMHTVTPAPPATKRFFPCLGQRLFAWLTAEHSPQGFEFPCPNLNHHHVLFLQLPSDDHVVTPRPGPRCHLSDDQEPHLVLQI
eukprot:GHUV01054716.1.p1 GENE.GHUV01054716.1~~GHUV01054716.1.p1  ORF type:complete len:107 (-),score=15.16 GHUV01054716.1:146-466(-)